MFLTMSVQMKAVIMVNKKKIIVTGASSGIGKQIALTFAKQGASLIICGRSEDRLKQVENEIGSSCVKALFDVTDANARKDFVNNLDSIDGIVHCAGVNRILPIGLFSEKNIFNLMNVNYVAPLLMTQELIKKRKLGKGASIVFISSVMSIVGNEGNSIYAGTKAALVGSMRCMALELAKRSIRVNCISPGFINTAMTDESIEINEEEIKKQISLHPLGAGETYDIANICAFLCSDDSKWITGQNLVVDGGYSAR